MLCAQVNPLDMVVELRIHLGRSLKLSETNREVCVTVCGINPASLPF